MAFKPDVASQEQEKEVSIEFQRLRDLMGSLRNLEGKCAYGAVKITASSVSFLVEVSIGQEKPLESGESGVNAVFTVSKEDVHTLVQEMERGKDGKLTYKEGSSPEFSVYDVINSFDPEITSLSGEEAVTEEQVGKIMKGQRTEQVEIEKEIEGLQAKNDPMNEGEIESLQKELGRVKDMLRLGGYKLDKLTK